MKIAFLWNPMRRRKKMPLNQRGSRVFGVPGSGYREVELKQMAAKRKSSKSSTEVKARKQFAENRHKHRSTSRAAFKLRNPR